MIYATADANPCIPIDNLSTAHKHYRTCTNLCSTIKSTLETYCNLSTAADLQHLHSVAQVLFCKQTNRLMQWSVMPAEPLIILARTLCIPFDHTAMGTHYSTALQDAANIHLQLIRLCSPTNIKPLHQPLAKPDINL